jgi:hypothetical protein
VTDDKVWKARILMLILYLSIMAGFMVVDHMRLVQVRQILMDHGTPIEMDKH